MPSRSSKLDSVDLVSSFEKLVAPVDRGFQHRRHNCRSSCVERRPPIPAFCLHTLMKYPSTRRDGTGLRVFEAKRMIRSVGKNLVIYTTINSYEVQCIHHDANGSGREEVLNSDYSIIDRVFSLYWTTALSPIAGRRSPATFWHLQYLRQTSYNTAKYFLETINLPDFPGVSGILCTGPRRATASSRLRRRPRLRAGWLWASHGTAQWWAIY